jgi:hypothetical protein
MSTRTRKRPFRILLAASLVAAAGCSLVNSFDDVAPRTDGTYAQADATVIDVVPPSDVVTTDSSGSDSGDAAIASGGAIVVGGRVEDDAGALHYVLSVLDPANGHEIGTRENMVVAGLQYDGLRDLWYIFESKSNDFVPGANDQVVLHVRELNAKTGAWTERSQRTVPVIQSFDSIGVTRERITYVAYQAPEAGSGLEYVTLNTQNPAQVTDVNKLSVDVTPFGAMSTRSATGAGGYVNYLRINTNDCDAGNICQMELLPVRITNNAPQFDPIVPLGYTVRFNVPSYAALTPPTDLDLVIFPRSGNDASAPSTIRRYDPVLHTEQQAPTDFIITDTGLKRAAVSNCANVAFVVGTNGDLRVHAIPIQANGGGTPTSASTGHSGQSVYFEPSSKTVLAPFAQGAGFDFSAFKLEGTSAAPALTKRTSDWTPPSDLRPILLGIREPLPIQCN